MPESSKPLGLVSATTLVAASMIGVGVYTTSGFTFAALETPGRVIAAWVVGGLIAICGAIGYGSLASRFKLSGGEYLFLSRSLHPVAGLVAGWISLLAGFTGAIAIAALGLESYLWPLISDAEKPTLPGVIAIAAVLIAATLHTIGVKGAARAQDLVVILKILMILGFIVVSLSTLKTWHVFNHPVDDLKAPPLSLRNFTKQLVYISFSYAGFNAAVYVSGEVRAPERNVPRALILGTILVTLIYISLNTIFVFAPSPAAITSGASINQIAATAAESIGGTNLDFFVRLVIVVSLFTSISALVMTGPRVYAKMAEDGFLPRWFCFHDRPPVKAIWFQAVIAVVAISISELKSLLGYLGLTLSICSALSVSMLFLLRWRGEKINMPMWGIPSAIYIVATVVLAILYGCSEHDQAIAAAATIAVGFVLYPFVSKRLQDQANTNLDA